MGDSFNQNHSGSGDNIQNFGKQPSLMTEAVMGHWLAATSGWPIVRIGTHGHNPASLQQAQSLANYLAKHGRNVKLGGGIGMMVGQHIGHVAVVDAPLDPYTGQTMILVDADK